jgi:predicted permease
LGNKPGGIKLQFKVPQNIDMQDKILGPLTMVQFIYAVIGGGICYAIYSTIPQPFSYVLVLPIALFVLALIFLKINERPFLDFLVSLAYFMTTPKSRMWHHDANSNLSVEIYQPKTTQQNITPTKQFTHEQIADFAKKVDQGQK